MNSNCYYKNFLTKPINNTVDEIIKIVLAKIITNIICYYLLVEKKLKRCLNSCTEDYYY